MISAKPSAEGFIVRWIRDTPFTFRKKMGRLKSIITLWQKGQFYSRPACLNISPILNLSMRRCVP